jgi:hypothetical protein
MRLGGRDTREWCLTRVSELPTRLLVSRRLPFPRVGAFVVSGTTRVFLLPSRGARRTGLTSRRFTGANTVGRPARSAFSPAAPHPLFIVGVGMELCVVLLFVGVLSVVELVFVRRDRRDRRHASHPEYRVGMVAVRRLIDDVEHGRILR